MGRGLPSDTPADPTRAAAAKFLWMNLPSEQPRSRRTRRSSPRSCLAIKDWSADLTILLTSSAGPNRDAAAWIIRAFQLACPEEETLCDAPPYLDP